MKNYHMLAGAMLSMLALPVAAAEVSQAITLSYGNLKSASFDDLSLRQLAFDYRGAFDFGNGVTAGAAFGLASDKLKGEDVKLHRNYFKLDGNYGVGEGAFVGAYVERSGLGLEVNGVDLMPDLIGKDSLALTSYGLQGGYKAEGYKVSAYFGKSTTNVGLINDVVDFRDFGASVGFRVSDQVELAANIARTEIDFGFDDANVDSVELAASYKVTSQFGMFGGYSHNKISAGGGSIAVPTIGVGVTYSVADTGYFDGTTIGLEYRSSNLDLNDLGAGRERMNGARLSITIPLGADKGGKLPLNSVAGKIQNPGHSALTRTMDTMF